MYCKICNREVHDVENNTCPYCGGHDFAEGQNNSFDNGYYSGGQGPQNNHMTAPPKPVNQTIYLIFAILTTVFCCPPIGIPAIVFAAQINSAQNHGDYRAAEESARKAKMFTIIAAIVGAVFIIGYFVLVFFGVMAGIGDAIYYY